MQKRVRLHSCLTGGCFIVLPVLVLAQAAGKSSGENRGASSASLGADQLEEVIVTAQKRDERLSDVPISIRVASGDQLARMGITNPAQLEKVVPGFTYALSIDGAPIYTLRGIGFYSDSIDVSPTVSIYVDQVPLPFSRMTEGASLDLERVEVLKGPQGTLFGQNSTGGAINYIAAKPTKEVKAGADFDYGRFNERNLGGFVSGPLSDTVTARIAVRAEHRDAWQQNYGLTGNSTSEKVNGVRDFTNGRVLLDWDPSDQFRVEINLSGWKDQSDSQAKQKITYAELVPNGFPGTPAFPNLQAQLAAFPNAPPDNRAAGFDPAQSLRRDDGFYQSSVRADLGLTPNVSLTSITSYSRLTVYDPNQNDGTIYPDEEITLRGDITAYTQELRLAGNAPRNDALKWLIGGNYEYDSTSNFQSSNVHGSGSGLGPVPIPPGSGSGYPPGLYTFRWTTFNLFNDNTIKTAAAFADLNYEIFNGLTAEGAVRFTDRRDTFAGCGADNGDGALAAGFSFLSSVFTNSPQVVTPGACATLRTDLKPLNTLFRDNLNEHNISYRAALSWKVTPKSLLYANVTKGYKGGAFETLPAIITSEFVSATQESVKAYEVGFKSFLFGRTLSLEGAVFYYDYLHKQTNGYIKEPIFGTLPALVSVPTSLVRGAELSSLWRPIRGLTLNAAGTYIDSAVTSDFQLPGAFGGVSNVRGSAFPNTPKWQATGDIEYEWPVSSTLAAFAGSGVTYHSSTIAAFAGGPLLNIDSYALLDVRAGIQAADGRWRAQLWGRNVTNKYYWLSAEHQQDTVARTTGMPATFGISLTARF